MKIVLDARLWNETGVGRYIRALVTNLQSIDQKNKYYVLLRRNEYNIVDFFNPKWHKVLADITWHSWAEQILLPKILTDINADFVHIPYFSVPIFIKQPFIVTIHDLTISHFATGKATTKSAITYLIKRMGYKMVLQQAITKARKIITVSNFVKNQLCQEYLLNPKKISVTYESGELEKNLDNNLFSPDLSNYLLYVGNAHPHKNLEKLLQAFKIINAQIPHINLALIGSDDFFYRRLEIYAKKNKLDKNVKFVNSVNNNELSNWYKKAILYIFPSLSEGFGLPGLEAMNNNCPVAAADIPVFREIYGDAAFYFNPNSIDDMAGQLKSLISNKDLLNSLTAKGRLQVCKYSWEKMARETLTIYENCFGI